MSIDQSKLLLRRRVHRCTFPTNVSGSRLPALVAGLGCIVASALPLSASAQMFLAPWVGAPSAAQVGAPKDWSHKHLSYSNPDSRDEAARKGAFVLEQWARHQQDSRFVAALQ